MKHELKMVRVYELGPDTEGYRILVDRLWPRGLRKEALEPFVWAKDIAPTKELRKWYCHVPERFGEFSEKYQEELDGSPYAAEFAEKVGKILDDQDVLLMYASKDREHNQAVVLKKWLEEKLGM
jgi:uncharacterized protein YeaO (DUF488 family)